MDTQKAIDNLISMKVEIKYESNDTKQMKRIKIETINEAIKALKKQIPTKPIRKSWELTRCPSCGAALGEWLGDGYTKDWESKTVCDCGQQIDWS